MTTDKTAPAIHLLSRNAIQTSDPFALEFALRAGNVSVPYGIYHLTDAGETSWYDFAREIYTIGSTRGRIQNRCEILPLRTDEYPTAAPRPHYSVLSKEKITSALGIEIKDWQLGLEEFFDRLDEEDGVLN